MSKLDTELKYCVKSMTAGTWYEGKQLDRLWKIGVNRRKTILKHLKARGLLDTKGTTAMTRYQLRSPLLEAAKKKANLPANISSLENLIAAATTLGTENELLKQALRDISATIDKIREYL